MPIYNIRGIDVDFPFEAYDCQIVYMEKVIQSLQQKSNALLESPTGTGKTLCLLCATLAWRKSLGDFSTNGKNRSVGGSQCDGFSSSQHSGLPTIVYTTRTHSQLHQVIQELKRTNYRPKMVVIGSREQLCIKDDVQELQGRAQTNACQFVRKKRKCPHYSRISEFVKENPSLGDDPIDIEDLVNIGRIQGPCPYYLSRELHKVVDILFAPYNYLIDRGNRKSLSINWQNSVLIFDEAHNLESICSDAASFDLPSGFLTACISEAQKCVDLAAEKRVFEKFNDKSTNPDAFAILKALLLKWEKRIAEVPINSRELGFTRPGPYIYELLADLNITPDTSNMLIDTITDGVTLLEDDESAKSSGSNKTKGGTVHRLETLADILQIIFNGGDKSHAESYRVHVQEAETRGFDSLKGKTSRTLSWWCFNPGIAMLEFAKMGVGSIILTSGTLSPLDSFAQELKLEFPVRLENPHVISSNQIWTGVVSTGPSGCSFNSSYRNRDSLAYKQDLGNAIANFARIVPDGLLVFFPSYYLLEQCIGCWKDMSHASSTISSTIWDRICKHKQPVVEPKQSSLFSSSIGDFMAKLNDKTTSGAVFFAVCRGKLVIAMDSSDTVTPSTGSNDPRDPARKYGKPDPNNKNNWDCCFCAKVTKGGAYRLKQHLVGGFRNVTKCTKCPEHVREEVKAFMLRKAEAKSINQMIRPQCDFVDVDDGDEEEVDSEMLNTKDGSSGKRSSSNLPKKPRHKGPLDMFVTSLPKDVLQGRKESQGIFGACYKQLREKACTDVARWFYDAGIPFNAATYDSFKVMCESIGQYGPGFKPPSMHELRVPLLKKEVNATDKLMDDHKKEWVTKGCSILSDGWRDSVAHKDIINFLVNSPKGSVFIKSMDVSEIVKDSTLLFKLLDDMVEEIGEENVIQVVTDNASNYVAAGKLLEAKRKHLYWTPCAAHCLDLMLEDIGKIPKVKNALKKCMLMNAYIYNHISLVNMMRRFTNQKNLHRPSVTRFATSFITLAQFHKQKNNLRKMVTSKDWTTSKWPKQAMGKKVATFILQDTFWRNVMYALKLTGPLVKVLRIVDGERKPPMGYIYEAMDRAKEAIQQSFGFKEEEYKDAFESIDRRWECQLHQPLHAAGFYLNPGIHYDQPDDVCCEEIEKGLYDCIGRLIPDVETQDKVMMELDAFKSATGLFGHPMAIRQRKSKSPADWWSTYGSSSPNLKSFAMKVLSLTCSATGCERNWGVFQHVSEGLDFADHTGRAVVVTGMPFSTWTDPKVRLKRDYLDRQGESGKKHIKALTGDEWYSQQASRAVNQAVGRVIRHRHDYGAIIFCDERFAQTNNRRQMSLWIQPYVKCYSSFGEVVFTLTRFFRDMVTAELGKSNLRGSFRSDSTSGVEISLRQNDFTLTKTATILTTTEEEDCCKKSSSVTTASKSNSRRMMEDILPANRSTLAPCKDNRSMTLKHSRDQFEKVNKLHSPDPSSQDNCHMSTVVDLTSNSEYNELLRTAESNLDCSSKKSKILKLAYDNMLQDMKKKSSSSSSSSGFLQKHRSQSHLAQWSSTKDGLNKSGGYTENADMRTMVVLVDNVASEQVTTKLPAQKDGPSGSISSNEESKGSAFLMQVQEKLTASEYKDFVGCMKALKDKTMKISTVLQSIATLFSSPDRHLLLKRFKDYLPAKFQPLYEQHLRLHNASASS